MKFNKEHLDLSLEEKVKLGHQIIDESLSQAQNPAVLVSGGADSLVLLDMVRQHDERIKTLIVNSGIGYPNYDEMIMRVIMDKKNVDYTIAIRDEEEYVKQYGIPLFPALRDLGYSKEELIEKGFHEECSDIKERAMRKLCDRVKPDMTFIGFLGTESPKRMNRLEKGGYIQMGKHENLSMPIAMFEKPEILQYLDNKGIEYVRGAYIGNESGILHKGDGNCWFCSNDVFNDWNTSKWKLLKENYPERWDKLIQYGVVEQVEDAYNKLGHPKIKATLEKLKENI